MTGIGRRVGLIVLTGVAVLGAWAAGVVVFFAVARAVAVIPLLYAAAALACLAAGAGLARLAAHAGRVAGRGRYALVTGTVATVVLAATAAATALRPLPASPDAHRPPVPPPGTRHWRLPNGDHLAYLRLAAPGRAAPTPVVLVGGGPGEADVTDPAQARLGAALARFGHDVYVYDQIGAGLSARLPDPAGYTVARHVADLDAIRARLGTRRMILIGASWGASLVASYLARHPDRVARVVFTSPAPMDYAQWPDVGAASARLPPLQRRRADALIPGDARFLFWYALTTVNPRAAHARTPDREADAYFSTYLRLIRPATVCEPAHLIGPAETGNGLYDNVFTTRDAARSQTDVPGRLARTGAPALIVTGSCNYIRPGVAQQYRATLPNSTHVCLKGAGHAVYLDRPVRYARLVGAFLRGDRPPDAPCG